MTGFRLSLRSRPDTEPVLQERPFDLLCLTMGFVLLVHATHLPWWLTTGPAVVLVARWRQRRSGGRNAPFWIKLPLIGLLLAAVIMQNGTLFGREPGSAFAVGLLVLKLLESEHRRDARVGIAFACFALMSALLFDQGLIASFFVSTGPHSRPGDTTLTGGGGTPVDAMVAGVRSRSSRAVGRSAPVVVRLPVCAPTEQPLVGHAAEWASSDRAVESPRAGRHARADDGRHAGPARDLRWDTATQRCALLPRLYDAVVRR